MHPSRSENNIGESSHSAVLSMPHNDVVRQPSYQSLPAPQYYDDPAIPRAHEATTSFLAGASGFRMRDIHYYEAAAPLPANRAGGVGNSSIDGMSKFIGIHREDGH
jgi:hypothetical protein